MNINGLTVSDRHSKPRTQGLTWCIDDGMPLHAFSDTIASFHRLIDGVKFGWGTALVTDCLRDKMAVCRQYDVEYCFGGTLVEAYWMQNRMEDFIRLVRASQCPVVEVSDGTVHLPLAERRRLIRELKAYARVFSEVGSKSPEASATWTAQHWIEQIKRDHRSGADLIILETRESGTAGLCQPNGAIRSDVSEGILASTLDPSYLMFEAPTKALQTYWILQLGATVNLSNIPLTAVVNLETLRLGLRSDTFSLLLAASAILPSAIMASH
ncbi:MAG: phosphosulfolactate synthase [Sulfobacillus acidophilus]|uniref:Phosphosulfolactate synthase n=1 Tax=Sulfobacillus acidophilus TaxID=53633 RepID=A0A2T2WFF9_9FIRM|nr:MAG: phosphosulfolactate synthase [Sulfobacillus acidophilus]